MLYWLYLLTLPNKYEQLFAHLAKSAIQAYVTETSEQTFALMYHGLYSYCLKVYTSIRITWYLSPIPILLTSEKNQGRNLRKSVEPFN